MLRKIVVGRHRPRLGVLGPEQLPEDDERVKRLIVCVAVLLIAGCAPPVTFGNVIDRQFVPEHEMSTFYYDEAIETMVQSSVIVPDKWYVTLQSLVEDKHGNYNSTQHEVSQSVYDNIREGEYYHIGDLASTKDCPMETER